MVQNIRPDISNSVNTVFSEQRVVESQPAHPTSILTLSSKVEAEMADETWFAKQQLMKPVQLSQIQWQATQPRDTDIYTASFPSVLQGVESIVLRTLRMYSFFKLSPCFRVQINATQFHQGQLICSFDPFSIAQRDPDELPDNFKFLFDHFYATGLPNVKIMASESDAVELCIPFIHPQSYFTTNDSSQGSLYNNLGTFRVTVLNPLVVAEGTSPNVTVTIWVYAKEAEVHVPIFDHGPILGILNGPVVEATSKTLGGSPSMLNQLSSLVSPILSSLKKGGSQTYTMIGNAVSGNFGQALRSGQGLVDTLGDLFGFDYPARTIQPPKTISPVENLAVGIGQSQSQRMAIDPFSMHLLEDEVAGETMNSMDLLSIAKMPMLLSQFAFTGTSPQDSLLFSCPVTPTVSALRNGYFRRTYLSAVSNAFTYWNGGINFDIEIVATRFHSGKLLFAFVPNDSVTPSYLSAADGLPNIIIDIQQTSSTRFKVPFVSAVPLKDVQRTTLEEFVPAPSPIPNDPYYSTTCIGTLVCYVQNLLNYASNVSPQVEVNVYISAADDFGLYVPGKPLLNKFQATTSPPSVVATSNEIGIDLNKNNQPVTAAVLAKGQLDSIPRNHFGEKYSMIDIIRRFTFYGNFSLTPAINFFNFIPVTPANPFNQEQNVTYLQYFSLLYSAFSGSIRYKYVLNTTRNQNLTFELAHLVDNSQYTAAAVPTGVAPETFNNVAGQAVVRTNAQQDCALEVEAPYYSKFNMLIHNLIYYREDNPQLDDDYIQNGSLVFKTNNPLDATDRYDVYTAAGEDFRFIYLRPMVADTTNVGYYLSTLA
uniref:Structural polyprotein n=1 Tax=Soybean thrips bicistronic virus 1 TaxID=2797877 RepID=A0A7T7WLU5_9VIRU|nr:structural polyprotein [Soybean thrips bicistronic virus 1]